MAGRDDHVRHALPIEETVAIMQRHRYSEVRLAGGRRGRGWRRRPA
jgi:hypothetical protein